MTAEDGRFDFGEYPRLQLTAERDRIFIRAEGDSRCLQAWANEVHIEGDSVTWVLDGRVPNRTEVDDEHS